MPRAPFHLRQAATRARALPAGARGGRAPFCLEATPRVGQANRSGAGAARYPGCPVRRRPWVLLLFARHPSSILLYSPKCLEEVFCELRKDGVLGSSAVLAGF